MESRYRFIFVVPDASCGHLGEVADEADDPDGGEGEEGDEGNGELGAVEVAGDGLVGVEDELVDYDQECEEGAGEPGHLHAQNGDSVIAADGSEPKIFVGEIDQGWRGFADDEWDSETNQEADAEHHDFDDEKLSFGLP